MISLLLPYLNFDPYMYKQQEEPMACSTPCSSCDCEGRDTVYCNDYIEADASPLTTQHRKFFAEEEARRAASPAGFFDRFCGENPSAPECKIYED